MAADDLWYYAKLGPDGKKLPKPACGIGNRWRARWKDDAGKFITKEFALKRDAEKHAAANQTDVSRGQYIDPGAGKITFRAYAEQWRANQVHKASTQVKVEADMRLHILPRFGDRPLSSIRPTDVQAWVKWLTDNLAPSTVNVTYGFGAAIFTAAVADRHIATSPCVGIKLPKKASTRIEPLPLALVNAVVAAVPDRDRALFMVGAMAGLRQGEALGLEVDGLALRRRGGVTVLRPDAATLRVNQQLSTLPGIAPFLGPPKTASSHRTIPIGQVLHDALVAHLEAFPVREVKVVDHSSGKPVTRVARMVFTTDDGKPIDRARAWRMFPKAWKAACAAHVEAATTPHARADAEGLVTRFATASFHDLRHFYASALIAQGANVKVVQARLGHATAIETLNTYSHLWPDSDDQTRDAMDRVFGADPGSADTAGATGIAGTKVVAVL